MRNLNVSELGCHPDDSTVLPQGSTHQQRVFIPKKSERDIICNLLTGITSMTTFLNDENLSSENALLIKNLVAYIEDKWPLTIPNQYVKFIGECCKGSPVAGSEMQMGFYVGPNNHTRTFNFWCCYHLSTGGQS